MTSNITSQIIYNTANQAVTAAGLAGIFNFANPRTYAIATAAGCIAQGVIQAAVSNLVNPNPEGVIITFALGTATGLFVAAKTGRLVDQNFSYLKTLGIQALVITGAAAVSYAAGLMPSKN